MAIFLAELKAFSRGRGDSAVAAAAYRAGRDLLDDRLGLVQRYARRTGVEAVEVFLPEGAPAWANDLERLWNAVEAAEARKDARVARELIVALPHELSAADRHALAQAVSRELVERYGVAVQLAVHAPDKRGDQRNHHAHVLFSTRRLDATGFGAKVRCLDDREDGPKQVEQLRQVVEQLTNAALAQAGSEARVDCRRLEVQAMEAEAAGDYDRAAQLTREPTRHLGRSATSVLRRTGSSDAAAFNRMVKAEHAQDLAAYLAKAHSAGRMMPPSYDHAPSTVRTQPTLSHRMVRPTPKVAKATGPGARVLNAQAQDNEKARRDVDAALRRYIEGLNRDAQWAARCMETFVALIGKPDELRLWQERCAENAELMPALRRYVDARAAVFARREALRKAQRDQAKATERRQRLQKESDTGPAQPSALHILARRRWKAQRAAQAARLRRAVLAEQEGLTQSAAAQRQARAAEAKLHDEVREAQRAINRLVRESSHPHSVEMPPTLYPQPEVPRPRMH